MATKEKQTWGRNGMTYAEAGAGGWKRPMKESYDACSWTIMLKPYLFEKGELKVSFTKLEPGININLYSNDTIIVEKANLKVGEIYSID